MPRWKKQTIEQRFWSYVDKSAGDKYCWLWSGHVQKNGYAQFSIKTWKENGRTKHLRIYAHRFAYEIVNGKIQSGKVIDHLCRVRSCCNPKHLEPVTQRENLLRGDTLPAANAAKRQCKKGHEFNDENTYIEKLEGRTKRHCRICRKDNMMRYKLKHN